MSATQSQHILNLSAELLDDIELSRLEADKLVLKCSRLARLVGSEEELEWLNYELSGYGGTADILDKYMSVTGRWTDYKERRGYWGPLAQIEALITSNQAKISHINMPDVSGDKAWLVTRDVLATINAAASAVSTFASIRSKVIALMHSFATKIYYEKMFSSIAASTFEVYQQKVDGLIGTSCGDVLAKIPSVVERLREGDVEAISQALTSCRRIIESFADAVYSPSAETAQLGGNTLKLDASKHLNRINVFISTLIESQSRRVRLRQNLSNLYDRVCAGVHSDVTAEEAYSLFLNTYLFLGEIFLLEESRGLGAANVMDGSENEPIP